MNKEERLVCVDKIEIRDHDGEAGNGSPGKLIGYAAKFFRASDPGTEYELGPDILERVAEVAFDRSLREQADVVGLFDHQGLPLGRTSAETMRVSTDQFGLRYEIDLPNTEEARSIKELVNRGDLNGSSFGFVVRQEEWSLEGGKEIRTLQDVDLKDVGPVAIPAYTATTVSARNLRYGGEAIRMAGYAIENRYQEQLVELKELRARHDKAAAEKQRLETEFANALADTSKFPVDVPVLEIPDEDYRRRLVLAKIRCTMESCR